LLRARGQGGRAADCRAGGGLAGDATADDRRTAKPELRRGKWARARHRSAHKLGPRRASRAADSKLLTSALRYVSHSRPAKTYLVTTPPTTLAWMQGAQIAASRRQLDRPLEVIIAVMRTAGMGPTQTGCVSRGPLPASQGAPSDRHHAPQPLSESWRSQAARSRADCRAPSRIAA